MIRIEINTLVSVVRAGANEVHKNFPTQREVQVDMNSNILQGACYNECDFRRN